MHLGSGRPHSTSAEFYLCSATIHTSFLRCSDHRRVHCSLILSLYLIQSSFNKVAEISKNAFVAKQENITCLHMPTETEAYFLMLVVQ